MLREHFRRDYTGLHISADRHLVRPLRLELWSFMKGMSLPFEDSVNIIIRILTAAIQTDTMSCTTEGVLGFCRPTCNCVRKNILMSLANT